MPDWSLLGGLAVAAGLLATRGRLRRHQQDAAADAAGLVPVGGLSHLPAALQRSALWALADGGFESRVVHGELARDAYDLDVTAFDLETLRDRRGEWAYLPVEPPFRIGATVSVVVCQLDRAFPHTLWKRQGRGDRVADDDAFTRATSATRLARAGLRLPSSYPAELPPGLGPAPLAVELPAEWRVYGDRGLVDTMLVGGFAATLTRAGRRDLVVELLDALVIVYPAARDVVGADAFADLTSTALAFVDGVVAATPGRAPRLG